MTYEVVWPLANNDYLTVPHIPIAVPPPRLEITSHSPQRCRDFFLAQQSRDWFTARAVARSLDADTERGRSVVLWAMQQLFQQGFLERQRSKVICKGTKPFEYRSVR